ncbi:MAG: hypothetical protein QOD42_2952 [Sphingomonadales bacterium]|jgi:hypothetical protein|nr:hypothetical protein [Sphingomonadales bacterium]
MTDIDSLKSGGRGAAPELRDDDDYRRAAEEEVHVFRGHVCQTERRGQPRSPLELMVDATEGFIPLWQRNMTLRWRFQERSLLRFRDPEAEKARVRALFVAAVAAWGVAAPIRFTEQSHAWDFEVVVRDADRCGPLGCTLARAFFPGEGQSDLAIYPMMFTLDPAEQVETLAHEIGHIFGLRHFFALTDEQAWPAVMFGAHEAESIMNYGDQSRLTDLDRADLGRLYELAWAGRLTDINTTPIRLLKPFSANRP